jgi:hypothetical protein
MCLFFTIFNLKVPGASCAEIRETRDEATNRPDAIDDFITALCCFVGKIN